MNRYLRLGLGVTLGLFWLFLYFYIANSSLAQSVTNAKLSLIPAEEEALLSGTTVSVSVLFESGGHDVDAVDVVILYDEAKVSIQNVQGTNLFASYPLLSAENGTIKISGLSNINEPVNENGTMATFDVHIKDGAIGSTSLAIVATGDSGSHVAEHGTATDVLGETVGATYSMGANPTATPTPIVESLPSTGISWPTYTLVFVMLLSFAFGFVVVR